MDDVKERERKEDVLKRTYTVLLQQSNEKWICGLAYTYDKRKL